MESAPNVRASCIQMSSISELVVHQAIDMAIVATELRMSSFLLPSPRLIIFLRVNS